MRVLCYFASGEEEAGGGRDQFVSGWNSVCRRWNWNGGWRFIAGVFFIMHVDVEGVKGLEKKMFKVVGEMIIFLFLSHASEMT